MNLKYFQKPHKLNEWQTRWYLKLQDYNFILQHILEKTDTRAEILSRKQQGYQDAQRQTMEKEDKHRSWDSNVQRKLNSRRKYTIERNLKE